jgi:transcriptional regulator with XRE-family HTH domain
MPTAQEKQAFSARLSAEIARKKNLKGATQLAREFNKVYRGESVSPQTVHKWLSGRTIPTNDKLQTLADWLGVDVHWLHYGPPPAARPKPLAPGEKYPPPTPEEIQFVSKVRELAPGDRNLVEDFVDRLYDISKK